MPKNFLLTTVLGIILLFSSGCAGVLLLGGGAGAGAGTIAYLRGELKSTEEASIDRTWQAAQKAIEELEFSVTSEEKDAFSAKLIARGANDKKVVINLQRITDELTEVSIRVGIFGEESLSLLVLERLQKHL